MDTETQGTWLVNTLTCCEGEGLVPQVETMEIPHLVYSQTLPYAFFHLVGPNYFPL